MSAIVWTVSVSVLFNEPKLLKIVIHPGPLSRSFVSVLFNEPKLLKSFRTRVRCRLTRGFSALQRAEIAESEDERSRAGHRRRFSALQRAEIAEIRPPLPAPPVSQIPIPARRRS